MPSTGRPGLTRAAGTLRRRLADPILRRVLAVIALGSALAAALTGQMSHRDSVLAGAGLSDAWLLPGLVVLTCLAEVTVVRLRHGDAVEELTLYEAAIIVDVLLLPPHLALAAAVSGLVLASALQRRPVVKALFNLGTYTAAVAALVMVVHAIGGTPGTMTARVLAGVLVGTFVFTAVNLCCLAQILGVVSGSPPMNIIRAEAPLSAYMAIGTVATGLTTAEIGLHSPLLLPFMAMPALAVTFAYRAAAQKSDESARSAVLLRLSHALAARDDVLRQFVVLVREAFDADLAAVLLEPDSGPAAGGGPSASTDTAVSVAAGTPDDIVVGPVPPALATLAPVYRPELRADGPPALFRQLLVAPLEGGGRRYGSVVLGVRARRGRLATRDLTVFAPLANALATAMSGTEHLRRLMAETSKLQAIAEQSTEGILMVDGDGAVQMWSRAFAELTSVSATDAAGRRLTDLLDLPDPADRPHLLPVTADQPQVTAQLTIRRPDGEPRRLRLAHSAVFSGDALVRDVIVVRDLTREHRTERLKSDFIATVSHELRTPLTPIIGYLDLLRTRGDRMTTEKRRDCLDLLADRAAHLSRLVEDLLLASRVGDDGDVSLHVAAGAHDLVEIVRRVVAPLATPRLVVDLPDHAVPVHCDDGRTLQVLANLIDNALKYSPEDAPVQVSMRMTAGSPVGGDDTAVGAMARVDVVDHGRGIPADQLEKIFDKFHRVEDPMTMSTSGTGLGLFIARRLARAMDGDVEVSSTLHVGSVFTLALPVG